MPRNPMLDRWQGREKTAPAYKHAPKQEKKTAMILGGRQIAASGRGWKKGDVEVPSVARIECKATQHDSFRVSREMLGKIEAACGLDGQFPILEIEFVDISGNSNGALCVIKRSDLYSLIERVTDAEGRSSNQETTAARPTQRTLKPVIRRSGKNG